MPPPASSLAGRGACASRPSSLACMSRLLFPVAGCALSACRQRRGAASQVHVQPQKRRRHRALSQLRALHHHLGTAAGSLRGSVGRSTAYLDSLLARYNASRRTDPFRFQHCWAAVRLLSESDRERRAGRRAQREIPGSRLASRGCRLDGRANHRRAGEASERHRAQVRRVGCLPKSRAPMRSGRAPGRPEPWAPASAAPPAGARPGRRSR